MRNKTNLSPLKIPRYIAKNLSRRNPRRVARQRVKYSFIMKIGFRTVVGKRDVNESGAMCAAPPLIKPRKKLIITNTATPAPPP